MAPRHCYKCGAKHEPPTGGKCGRQTVQHEQSDMGAILQELQKLNDRVKAVEESSKLGAALQMEDPQTTEGEHQAQGVPQGSGTDSRATLTSLQRNASLQKEVMQRFSELLDDSDNEDGDKKWLFRGKKSGRVRTADDRVVKQVQWPHFHVFKSGNAESVKYNDMTIAEFVYGFASQLLTENGPVDWKGQISHLRDLMQDSADYSWENARNFHGIVLSHIERGLITWQSKDDIALLRRRFSQRVGSSQQGSSKMVDPKKKVPEKQATEKKGGRRCCRAYNVDFCSVQDKTHKTTAGDTLVHCCSYCWRVFRQERAHKESNCMHKKDISFSKNDQKKGQ